MKRVLIIVMLMPPVLSLITSSVNAEDVTSGNEFISDCGEAVKFLDGNVNTTNITHVMVCFSYIVGVTDAVFVMKTARPFCAPEVGTVGQHTRIVHRYMKEHPEHLHLHRYMLVEAAMKEAYPCSK